MDCGATHSERLLTVQPSRREVLRYLGYPPSKKPRGRVAEALERMWPIAQGALAAKGAFRLVDAAEMAATGMPEPTDQVAVGLCSIGPILEQRAQQLKEQGDLLGALVLDAFGSAAAESATDALDQQLCHAVRARGLHAGPRISPGYGRWDVRYQRQLLALLPTDELGVTLTEGMMMVPRKSVSFAVRLEPEVSESVKAPTPTKCQRCTLEQCVYRVVVD